MPFADSPAGKYPDSRKIRIASVASISQITTSGAIRRRASISNFLSFMICEINAVSSQRINEEVFPTRNLPCFFATSAIAPGPLEHEISQALAMMAEIESRGGATVYRFTEATIRRALDHGKTGDEIKTFLAKTSKTPMLIAANVQMVTASTKYQTYCLA